MNENVSEELVETDLGAGISTSKKKSNSKPSKKKALMIFFGVLFFVFLSILGYGVYLTFRVNRILGDAYVETFTEDMRRFHHEFRFGEVPSSILLLGIDALSMTEYAFSDAIVLVTINPNDRSVKIVSFHRYLIFHDSIEVFHPFDRLAYNYVLGGPSLTMDVLQMAINVPVDRFVAVDFKGFANVIDAIGGVTVYNDGEPFGFSSGYVGFDDARRYVWFDSGELHLSGMEAIEYARQRNHDPDNGEISRQDRQRQIIEASMRGVTNDLLFTHQEILSAIDGHFMLNMLPFEIIATLTPFVNGIDDITHYSLNGTQFILEGEERYHDFRIVDQLELSELTRILRQHLELPPLD